MNEAVNNVISNIKSGVKIVFLGVGSPLRADDSVGLYIVEQLEQALKTDATKEFRFYLGESAPENFTGEIRSFRPTHLMIFDAADLGEVPGTFAVIPREKIGGTSFSTHVLPLKMLADYLVMATGCTVSVIGIQPQNLEFGEPLSPGVEAKAAEFVAKTSTIWNQRT